MIDFVVGTYPYSAFDCMFLSRHVRILDWIYTPHLTVMELKLLQKGAVLEFKCNYRL